MLQRLLALIGRSPHPRIVVTGMPKSGTTAIAMLAGAAAGLKVNSDPFNRLDQAGVDFRDALYGGQLTLRELVRRHSRCFAGGLLKDPNFIYLPEVFEVFAGAGLVFTVRDPRDNIRSLLNRLRLPGRLDATTATGAGISATWRRVLEGRTPDVPGTNYIERLAHRWALAVRNYLDGQQRLQLIRYEEFMQGKVAAVEATLAAIGIPGGQPIEHLLERDFQPRGQRGVDPREFFGAVELESIERICGPEMARLGYRIPQHSA